MKGPGYMSLITGEVVHIVKCIPVEVKYCKTEECYRQLPIFRGNQSFFFSPRTHISTSLFPMVLPFSKIQYFLIDKYLIFIMTIPIPSAEEFQLFKPHPIPIHLNFNTDVISSIYIKPQNSYLTISSNNQSYFTTNENFLNACYQNGFQTFCHPPRSISNIDKNPIYCKIARVTTRATTI